MPSITCTGFDSFAIHSLTHSFSQIIVIFINLCTRYLFSYGYYLFI